MKKCRKNNSFLRPILGRDAMLFQHQHLAIRHLGPSQWCWWCVCVSGCLGIPASKDLFNPDDHVKNKKRLQELQNQVTYGISLGGGGKFTFNLIGCSHLRREKNKPTDQTHFAKLPLVGHWRPLPGPGPIWRGSWGNI